MKLYDLDVGVFEIKKSTGRSNIIGKFQLTLEGGLWVHDEGDWSAADPGSRYLGQSSGYWKTQKNDFGDRTIFLMEDEDPNMISWLWRDIPLGLASLDGILKLPLVLGQTGTGFILSDIHPSVREPPPVRELGWKVANRLF